MAGRRVSRILVLALVLGTTGGLDAQTLRLGRAVDPPELDRFTRAGDPTSLRFARGFEPDFARGIVERSSSNSRLYGGRLRRFRILSRNQQVQYLFLLFLFLHSLYYLL